MHKKTEDLFHHEIDLETEIIDEHAISRVLREIKWLQTKKDQYSAQFLEEVEYIKKRYSHYAEPTDQRIDHLKACVLAYHQEKGIKSHSYPQGDVTIRTPKPTVEIPKTQETTDWVEQRLPSMIKQNPTFDARAIKKLITRTEDGEMKLVDENGELHSITDTPFKEVQKPESLAISFKERKTENEF